MTDLTDTELKVVRQYLAPNTRLEVDTHLRTGLPLSEPLVQLLRRKLAKHKEAQNEQDPRRA